MSNLTVVIDYLEDLGWKETSKYTYEKTFEDGKHYRYLVDDLKCIHQVKNPSGINWLTTRSSDHTENIANAILQSYGG